MTVYTGKVEVGQNIRTSLSQCVAEELHVPVSRIQMVMGDTQLTPFDMGTFGSRTTPTMSPQLRKVAAAARDLLIGLAAAEWQIDRKRLIAADGRVTDPESKRTLEYAALAKGQQLTQTISTEDPLIPAAQWTVQGQSLPKVDGRDFVTGSIGIRATRNYRECCTARFCVQHLSERPLLPLTRIKLNKFRVSPLSVMAILSEWRLPAQKLPRVPSPPFARSGRLSRSPRIKSCLTT